MFFFSFFLSEAVVWARMPNRSFHPNPPLLGQDDISFSFLNIISCLIIMEISMQMVNILSQGVLDLN